MDEALSHPVAEAIGAIADAVAGAVEAPLWSLRDADVARLVDAVHAAEASVAELRSRLVAEADRRDLAGQMGATSTAAWLRRRRRMHPAAARADVDLARALSGLPATRVALANGAISEEQARVVVKGIAGLPGELAPDLRRDAERYLIEQAATFDPLDLARLARTLLEVVDPEAADARLAAQLALAEARAERGEFLTMSPTGWGTERVRGELGPEAAAVLRAAVDPLAAPAPSAADGPDPRSPERRRANALVELCRRQLAGGGLPDNGGDRPRVVVTIDEDRLQSHTGYGVLDTGEPLSVAAVRRLACDAQVIPAVLGGAGQVLDLGRAARTFTGHLRTALVVRSGGGCEFPGCDRPTAWCDGHHIVHWADGGPTCLDNAVLLCGHHHRLVHRNEWTVRMAADKLPEFLPPDWVDAERRPLRHARHRRRRAA